MGLLPGSQELKMPPHIIILRFVADKLRKAGQDFALLASGEEPFLSAMIVVSHIFIESRPAQLCEHLLDHLLDQLLVSPWDVLALVDIMVGVICLVGSPSSFVFVVAGQAIRSQLLGLLHDPLHFLLPLNDGLFDLNT